MDSEGKKPKEELERGLSKAACGIRNMGFLQRKARFIRSTALV